MKSQSKKVLSVLITIFLLLLLFTACGYGEASSWDCPECGRTGNTGNYCGTCACPAPWGRETDDSAVSPSTTETQSIESTSETTSLPDVPVLSKTYPGSDAHLRKSSDDGFRVYSYTGPSKTFVPSGGYKPYKQRKITVFFEEDNWVLADVLYQTAEERVVYLPKSSFDSIGNIPVVTELGYYIGTVTTNVEPSWGPDNRFNSVKSLMINEGTKAKVYFQENGFVYAEYECEKGTVRMWLPANSIEINDATVTYSETPINPAGQSDFR